MQRERFGVVFWMAVVWLGIVTVWAVLGDLLPIRNPEDLGIRTGEVGRFEGPGWNAWFGGDGQGRDQFARVVVGARPALILGLVATVIAATIGTMAGVVAAYRRGWVDLVIAALIDLALAFPALVLLIAVRSTYGPSLTVFVAIFAITGIPTYARIVRGAALSLVERDFVDAARSMGASHVRVLTREILPNLVLPVLSFACLGFAIVILTEGGLAFLGLSLTDATWGTLISEGNGVIEDHPHLALLPATVLFLTILSFNLVGDGLRRIFAPRERQRVSDRVVPASSLETPSGAALHIAELHTVLGTPDGEVRAVDGVSVSVDPGTALGVVGESGSGKTMVLRSILGTLPLAEVTRSGSIQVAGVDMLNGSGADIQSTLGTRIGAVSQNPLAALHPTKRIGQQIAEPMMVHLGTSRADATERALDLLRQVGIPAPEQRLRDYPHQLSGGMRQRVTIAIALANDPDLLLADEPTTALDVTVQAQILDLLAELQRERGMSLVLVTHDLAVVRGYTDHLAIMYSGQIVEYGPTEAIFANPRHRYTVALLRSMPDLTAPSHSELTTIDGAPPSLLAPPPGCRFAPRCTAATEQCHAEPPPETVIGDQRFRCWHPSEQPVELAHGR